VTRLYLGLGLAAALWGVVFRLGPFDFWAEITVAVLLIVAFAAYNARDELRGHFRYASGMTMAGVAGAALLYAVFVIGSWTSRQILPFAAGQIADIYEVRGTAPTWLVAVLLAAIIAPGEEIFWRGYVQGTLAFNFGDVRGWLLMAALYALVHLWAWNFMLIASAFICGLFWGYLFHRFKSLVPCIISHVIWDLAVFIYYPIMR
jgi:membrane protease YdiL (CAAX protease family)